MHKTVKHLIPAETINMGGIFVKQALPTQNVAEVGPFILLHIRASDHTLIKVSPQLPL